MAAEKIQGGAFGGVDDLYREVILEHFKSPRNKGILDNANTQAEGMNPLCGDQIQIQAIIENGAIKDIKFDGHGCAISQSSASMMTAQVKGKTIEQTLALTQLFKNIFGIPASSAMETQKLTTSDLGDLEALEGVKKYPVRIKCALLAWNTLLESIKKI